jgi:hypothetical protein
VNRGEKAGARGKSHLTALSLEYLSIADPQYLLTGAKLCKSDVDLHHLFILITT